MATTCGRGVRQRRAGGAVVAEHHSQARPAAADPDPLPVGRPPAPPARPRARRRPGPSRGAATRRPHWRPHRRRPRSARPRRCLIAGPAPASTGKRFGTTRTRQPPSGSASRRTSPGVSASRPGQNGQSGSAAMRPPAARGAGGRTARARSPPTPAERVPAQLGPRSRPARDRAEEPRGGTAPERRGSAGGRTPSRTRTPGPAVAVCSPLPGTRIPPTGARLSPARPAAQRPALVGPAPTRAPMSRSSSATRRGSRNLRRTCSRPAAANSRAAARRCPQPTPGRSPLGLGQPTPAAQQAVMNRLRHPEELLRRADRPPLHDHAQVPQQRNLRTQDLGHPPAVGRGVHMRPSQRPGRRVQNLLADAPPVRLGPLDPHINRLQQTGSLHLRPRRSGRSRCPIASATTMRDRRPSPCRSART